MASITFISFNFMQKTTTIINISLPKRENRGKLGNLLILCAEL